MKRSADVNTFSTKTTIKCAEYILKNTTDDVLYKTDFIDLISEHKGISKTSVDGTCFGNNINPTPNKIMGKPIFIENWVACKSSTGQLRFARKGTKYDTNRVKATYDTEGKRAARVAGAEKYLRKTRKKNPVIVTLAGEGGYDVIEYLKIKHGAEIHCVENNPLVYDKIQARKLNATTHLMDLCKFLENWDGRSIDLLNYDSPGYVCKSVLKTLEIVNRKKSAKIVCLTVQHLYGFRNHGSMTNYLKLQYGDYDDPTMEVFKQEWMQNYNIIEDFVYKRVDKPGHLMRTIIFRLK